MTGGIYQILSAKNGHRYIGSSIDFKDRKERHWRYLKRGDHYNLHLQRAWDKYGEESFKLSPLIHLEPWELIRHEQFFIDTVRPEYNICQRADSKLGVKHSEETKKKMSVRAKGRKLSKEHCAKISAIAKSRTLSNETKTKISMALKGKPWSLARRAAHEKSK